MRIRTLSLTASSAMCMFPLFAKIEMGIPFSDGAVLQRGREVPVWGSAEAGKKVTVSFAGRKVSAKANAHGKWRVRLPAMEASKEERAMTVSEGSDGVASQSDAVVIRNVLVGEVWFAAGQSNMECPIIGGSTRYRDGKGMLVAQMTRLPCVRFARSDHQWLVRPGKAKTRGWKRFDPLEFRGSTFSAIAFYFARELYLALDVPIGIVDASWGGTNIDAWTPRCGYEGCDPSIRDVAEYPVKQSWNSATDRHGSITGAQQQPTVIFNGMVASWAPMAMRGFIWYQGCHNGGEPQFYCAKMHALYNGWSRAFGNSGLKLYFVQLAPWKTNWNALVEAQNLFAQEEKNAAISVTADVGNFDDIHPNEKEIVAKRLVVHALKRDYGFDIPEDDSPMFKSAVFSNGEVAIEFGHVTDWYVYAANRSRDAPFEVADEDDVWSAAKIVNFRRQVAKDGKRTETDFIDGSRIVVRSDAVPNPIKVRYMGAPHTMSTLYNQVGLPLGPFEAKK